jgi:glucose-6-phosphate 1-dehydrogenase
MDDQAFRSKAAGAIENKSGRDAKKRDNFLQLLFYRPIEYDNAESYSDLSAFLDKTEKARGVPKNRIFYLAIPPVLYETTAQMLGRAGLSEEAADGGWSRIVVEKPFGKDLDSARHLDGVLHQYFKEHQIFRIDHYLAKETVQNIILFRFANTIFEPVWNRSHIEKISITAAETLGVEHRAGYYEQSGVLRDMFQNHMMQLLALTAMEPPSLFEADRVRDEKVKLYRCLRPFPVDNLDDHIVLGQYGPGRMEGSEVPGYRSEKDVSPHSLTPTFAMMKVFVDNWRWHGVPFFLCSGKRLERKETLIVIDFKPVPHSMFRQTLGAGIHANRLVVGIYPEEKITLTFQAKSPGTRVRLRPVTMELPYYQKKDTPVLDSYEKVLQDCISGDQTLFWRQDGVELCWSFLSPILEACETCGDRSERLHTYQAGSSGPDVAKLLYENKRIS